MGLAIGILMTWPAHRIRLTSAVWCGWFSEKLLQFNVPVPAPYSVQYSPHFMTVQVKRSYQRQLQFRSKATRFNRRVLLSRKKVRIPAVMRLWISLLISLPVILSDSKQTGSFTTSRLDCHIWSLCLSCTQFWPRSSPSQSVLVQPSVQCTFHLRSQVGV